MKTYRIVKDCSVWSSLDRTDHVEVRPLKADDVIHVGATDTTVGSDGRTYAYHKVEDGFIFVLNAREVHSTAVDG